MDYQAIKRVPDGHWNDFANHIRFRDYVADKLDLRNPDDWYGVSTDTIRKKMRGNGLLNSKYDGQTLAFLRAVMPDVIWYPWLFKTPLKKFWEDIDIQKLYLEWLGNRLGWTTRQDYYKLTRRIIIENEGSGLLSYYNGSPIQLLTALLPPPESDEEWYPWLFDSTPNNYWDSIENRCKYADWLFKRLGFTVMEDWYKTTQDTFRENHGSGLILNPRTYNSSHVAFLTEVYPDYTFLPWLFQQTTQGFWKRLENRLEAMKWFAEQCGLKTADDLYRVTREDIRRNSLGGLLAHYYGDSLPRMIVELNPDLSLDISKFIVHKTEAKLIAYLKKHNIRYETQYKIHRGKKNGWFKMDVYLPDLGICIEIDGMQHFRQVRKWLDPSLQKRRDIFKMFRLKEKGLGCIRLLQEEVLEEPESWLDINLLPLLCASDEIEPIYVTTHTANSGLYDEHKELYASGAIHVDDLYEDEQDLEEDSNESACASPASEEAVRLEATQMGGAGAGAGAIQPKNYHTKTHKELIALCRENGIRGYSNKKVHELIALLTGSQ
jgi:very-short-patch-repair endonuclease